MRIVVFGASGNVGTSLLATLADDPGVDSVLGVARRLPGLEVPKTRWARADIASSDLLPLVRGADAVVSLAWLIQPSRDEAAQRRTNVEGSTRVFRATAEAGVPALVYASSVGAYSPGPKDRAVAESWPTEGIHSNAYSRQKAEVERRLDRFEREAPEVRCVRLRTALVFKREAGTGVRRLFLGPLTPRALVRPSLLPVVPDVPRLRFQAVHSLDVGQAYRLAATRDVRGAFNVAAEPVLDPRTLGRTLGARPLPLRAGLLRALADVTWRLRLQPTPGSWIDLALGVPIMDTTRARTELGWEPRVAADDALLELLEGMREDAGLPTGPLSPASSGPARSREFATGVGERDRA